MKYLKTVLKIITFAFLGLVIALAILPYVFKDKIIQYLKDDINANLNAEVKFDDIDISVFKSFPDLRLRIDSLSLTGIDDFEDIVLYKADQTSFDINLPSLFGKNIVPRINAIKLQNPEINIVILDSIHTNYLIMKDTSTSDEGKFTLQLKYYEINNGRITYQDNTKPFYMAIDSLNHNGSGDFSQDIFELKTSSRAKKLLIKYDGTTFINNLAVDLDAAINMNLPEDKYTLIDNILKLNELEVKGAGFVQFKDDDIITDMEFNTASEDFKSFLSIIPNAYTKDFAKVKTSGKAAISGKVSGIYNDVKNMMPIFDVKIKIDNGYFKYPSLPQDVKNLYADINIKTTRPDYKDMSANIPSFRMNIGNDGISGRLLANNLTGNQQLEGNLKGTLNLDNLTKAFPIENMEVLKGIIQCDLTFDAKMSDINAERYQAIRFDGNATAQNLKIKTKSMPEIRIGQATATASPKEISFISHNMILGQSDLDLTADVQNPLAFFSTEKKMKVNIKGNSNYFNLDEWMTEEPKGSKSNTELTAVPANEDIIKKSNMNLNLQAKKVKMNGYNLQPFNMDANLSANAMDIKNFNTSIEGSDIRLSGTVVNAYDYLFNNGTLDGNLHLTSNKLDLNKFMLDTPSKTDEAPMSIIPVPERVRLKMNASVGELNYTNMTLKDANGELEVQNREVVLNNFDTKLLGGSFGLKGFYSTADLSKPEYSVKLDINKIKYADAIKTFDLLKKAAPIAEFLDGFFNTSLVMKGTLGQNMMPQISTLDASGLIETLNGTIKGFNPLSKLSSLLGIKELSDIDLVNTRNWFEIADGFVEVKEFTKTIHGIDMTMSGKHGINQDMSYNIDLIIPREMLKGNKITGAAESSLKLLEQEASKLGINIDQGPNLFVNVKMTGNLKNPKFKITPKSSSGKNLQGELTDKGQEILSAAKDSLNKELKHQQEKLKDTITKRVNKEIDKAKSKAEEKGQKAIDSLKSKAKSEVENKIDSLTKGIVNDSLKQKAKDIIEKGAGEEIDKIKDKLKDFNPFKNKKKG